MHITGHLLIWTVALVWAVGLYFSSSVVIVRNAWREKIQADVAATERAETALKALQDDAATKAGLLERELLGWGTYATVDAGALDNAGRLTISSLPVQQDSNLFVFGFDQAGASEYIGAYRVVQTGQQMTLAPDFRFRPITDPNSQNPGDKFRDNPATLKQSQRVRVRTQIPGEFHAGYRDLDARLLTADELLTDRIREIGRQGELLATAEAQLQFREGEISGVAELQDKEIPVEFRYGLIAAMEEEEETRAGIMLEVDRLRKALKLTTEDFNRIRLLNAQLEKSLPHPGIANDVAGR